MFAAVRLSFLLCVVRCIVCNSCIALCVSCITASLKRVERRLERPKGGEEGAALQSDRARKVGFLPIFFAEVIFCLGNRIFGWITKRTRFLEKSQLIEDANPQNFS